MKETYSDADRLKYARENSPHYPANEIHESVKHGPIALGGDGFGWVRDENKKLVPMPHRGNIVIHRDVEIGSYCSIDRAVDGSTLIMEGTKIGHHVHIGHGAKIGRHCLIVDRVGIGGSCEIGDYVYIGHGATIRNKVVIGEGAFIGQHANVVCDVPAGETWAGNPARKLEKSKK